MGHRMTGISWTVIGSLIITAGAGIAGLYSFRGDIALVIGGFVLFVLGYRVSQIGIHSKISGLSSDLVPSTDSDSRKQTLSRAIFLVGGVVGIGTGVTLFTQTILSPGMGRAALSGVTSIGGYMSAHVGINGVGLGDSILEVFQDDEKGSSGNDGQQDPEHEESESETSASRWVGLLIGMAITSVSLSSGFIWACGDTCINNPVVWSEARHEILVFGAAFSAWWGYLIAHYGWTGTFIDKSAHSTEVDNHEHVDGKVETPWLRRTGVVFGVGILVVGMVIGVIFIRQGNHLMTNIGGALFLGGYLIGHYVETGNPL